MANNSIPCDVVILPDDLLTSSAVSASRSLAQFDSFYVLEDGKFYPHVSLYMTQLKTDDLDKVKADLADVAKQAVPLQLEANRYDHTDGYIDVEYKKTPELERLQDRVIEGINPIRDGMREKDKARLLQATGLVKENLEKYGYKSVGDLFRPHITLSRLKEEHVESLRTLGELAKFNGTFSRMGLFEMGDNGTCVRQIAEFKFIK